MCPAKESNILVLSRIMSLHILFFIPQKYSEHNFRILYLIKFRNLRYITGPLNDALAHTEHVKHAPAQFNYTPAC